MGKKKSRSGIPNEKIIDISAIVAKVEDGLSRNKHYTPAALEHAQVVGGFSPQLIELLEGNLDPQWLGAEVFGDADEVPSELREFLEPGDAIHRWRCEPRTTHLMAGAAGYAVVRDGQIVSFSTLEYLSGR